MINAGRQISWLGTNLSNCIIKAQKAPGRRGINTSKVLSQQSHTDTKDEKSDSHDESIDTSKYEPASPGVPRGYLDKFRRQMKPVVKELFCGRVDTRIFSYPDVINNEAYDDMFQRCSSVKNILKEKKELLDSIDSDGKVSKDLLFSLRSQGFYGLDIPENEGGEGLSLTEKLRLIEELSVNLSLSESIVTPVTLGYKAIQLYGKDNQKSKYLPSLTSGQKIGAICITDELCGSDPTMTSVKASWDDVDNVYVLEGTKTWVANGPSADIFTVFANCITKGNITHTADTTLAPQPKLTAFLVERSMAGVHIHSDKIYNKVGLKGLETCSVTFDNVLLKSEHVIGDEGQGSEILQQTLSSDRLTSAAKITASLRLLLNDTIRHACRRKQFQKRLIDFELIQQKISSSAYHLFALESAVYMTAGLGDFQLQPDITVESAAVKRYSMKIASMIVENCFSILGGSTYLEDNPHNKVANDLKAFNWWQGTDEMLAFHITTEGIHHVATEIQNPVTHQRNGLTFPFEVIKRVAQNHRVSRDKPKMTLSLGDHVHPSLSNLAEGLEYFVHRFHFAIEAVLVQQGQNAAFKEMDLYRMADVATEIYMLMSALARANRSYCGGHEHADHETHLIFAYMNEREPVLKNIINELLTDYWEKRDVTNIDIAKYIADRGCYCPVHPVTKNWF